MWYFENQELVDIPEGAIGFVYCITNNLSRRSYIGKKLFHSAKTKQVKKKKKRYKVESDWRTYYGSNKELQADVEKHGAEHFTRTILRICYTKGECSYFEAKEQFSRGVLEQPDAYYNEWIMARVHRKHLKWQNSN